MIPISDDSLKSFREIWDKAEARIKRTEKLNSSLVIPAVNELRYAGYHLLQALVYKPDSGADDEPAESVKKGTLHCRRATYDAVDAESMYYLEAAKNFEQQFENIVIDVPNFDYMTVRARIREARDTMGAARGSYETRDVYYQKMISSCDELKAAIDKMDDARIELVKRQRQQEEQQRKEAKEQEERRRQDARELEERQRRDARELEERQRQDAKDRARERITRIRWYAGVIIGVVTSGAAFGIFKLYLDSSKTAQAQKPDASITLPASAR